MNKIQGIPASPGLAEGPAYIYRQPQWEVDRYSVDNPLAEMDRLHKALSIAGQELEGIAAQAVEQTGSDEARIFEAHRMILEDDALLDSVRSRVFDHQVNVEAAWVEMIEGYERQLSSIENEYLAARAVDIHDVGRRVLRCLYGYPDDCLSKINTPSVIVADDLSPSDTVRLNKEYIIGFCTSAGGSTSHTAILAKALGIPAVVGLGDQFGEIHSGTTLLVDGMSGEITIAPDQLTVADFRQHQTEYTNRTRAELTVARMPAVTQDGQEIEVVANVGSVTDAEVAIKSGAMGVGLLRTEFLYLNRQTAPSEDEQFARYREILDVMETRPVIVRTLDVGGDKPLSYIDLGEEDNPFLGWRAIRMCLDRPDFFKTQLRALLRASSGHKLRIMFPMIATLQEVRKAKMILQEARCEVLHAGYAVADDILVGIMVEIPAVTVLADLFAQEVDFFSIGTNDLTQYTLAADRDNPRVVHLGDACNPAVLRQIDRVVQCAHAAGIWVGVCGEIAGDTDAIPILLGLGVDELSAAPASVPHIKAVVRSWSMQGARQLAKRSLNFDSAEAIRNFSRQTLPG